MVARRRPRGRRLPVAGRAGSGSVREKESAAMRRSRAGRTPRRAARPCREPSATARGTRAGRGSRTAAPRISVRARAGQAPHSGAAPRIRPHSSAAQRDDQRVGRQRRTEEPRQRTDSRSPPAALSQERQQAHRTATIATATMQREQDEPRNRRGEHRRVKQRVDPARVRAGERTFQSRSRPIRVAIMPARADDDRERRGAQAAERAGWRAAATAKPARSERTPPAVKAARGRMFPESRTVPTGARRRRSPRRAPTPRRCRGRPTRSILMPAS